MLDAVETGWRAVYIWIYNKGTCWKFRKDLSAETCMIIKMRKSAVSGQN